MTPVDSNTRSDSVGWMPIETLVLDGRPIIVGVWVDSADDGRPRWSSWTIDASLPLGCDGEWGDDPTYFSEAPTPPALEERRG